VELAARFTAFPVAPTLAERNWSTPTSRRKVSRTRPIRWTTPATTTSES